jgi:hypothetical protein
MRQAAIRLRLFKRTHLWHTYPVQYNTFSPEDFDIGKLFTLKLAGGGEKGVSMLSRENRTAGVLGSLRAYI